jgi:LssY C-terminus
MSPHTFRRPFGNLMIFLVFILLVLLFGPCVRPAAAQFERVLASFTAQSDNQSAPGAATASSTSVDRAGAPGARRLHQEIALTGDQHWSDTGIDLKAGERLTVTAKGTLQYLGAKATGPEGPPRGFKDLLRILPDNQAGRGALIGRIGDADVAQPFVVGATHDAVVRVPGRLFLGINQVSSESADGSFTATVEVFAPSTASAAAAASPATTIPGVTPDLLRQIPRRISDKAGDPGDMTNFLLIGSEAQVLQVFKDAGWVKVDKDTKGAVFHGLLESLSKESYVEMPMSVLYLFGRPQDYGFAHAEPIKVVSSRHHLRLWKSSLTADGQPVWVGAATHDIGFERDQRNNGVTHKIDPDVDTEREFLGKTFLETGEFSALVRVTPSDAVKDARTATGGGFHSSGEVLIMRLADAPSEQK